MLQRVRSIVWMSDRLSGVLRGLLSSELTIVDSPQAWLAAPRDAQTISFVDGSTLASLDQLASASAAGPPGRVIAICEDPLQSAIGWLPTRPWLSHVVSAGTLQTPIAAEHLRNVMRTLASSDQPRLLDWIGSTVNGRRVRLAHASRRAERLDRLTAFFDDQGVSSRTVELLRDAAEELLTNAFYDAPVAAGALAKPISRTQDVSLSDDSACDMVYGCRDDLAVVRVRDPFGSLTRARLIEVLTRCARTDMAVEVDETMGGAGLGLWRIFSAASFLSLAVVRGRYTEFLIGIGKRVATRPRPFAFHLFFKEPSRMPRRWRLLDTDATEPNINKSVTLVTK
jgi:hypothetical protein